MIHIKVPIHLNWIMRKCIKCGRYTLKKDKCPYCGGPLRIPHPPRFSPQDKYVKYRIMLKKEKSPRNTL